MRFVLFSDLHLDRTFTWSRPVSARRRRRNIRDCLVRIVELAEEVDADAILSAGDLYEHEHFTAETGRFLRQTFAEAGRPVILAPGNHDPLTPGSLYRTVDWSENVHVFDRRELTPLELTDGLRLWGAAHHVAAGTPGFLDGFRADGDATHYALFHGSEESSLGREGEAKKPHAPFTVDQIAAAGLTHAMVGHYHTPADEPWHTYPGNPDPLSFGESGQRAAVVVDVRPDGPPQRERRTVAVSQVSDVTVDVTGAVTSDEILREVRRRVTESGDAVRVTLQGELDPGIDLHHGDVTGCGDDERDVVLKLGALHVAYDLEAIAAEQTVRGRFVRDVRDDGDLDADERRRVLVTGLRALDGRADLEVV